MITIQAKFWTIAVVSISLANCSKDAKICDNYTELIDRNNLVDPNSLGSQALLDTLTKHPELQVYQINNDQYSWTVKCNVFYKDIKVFGCQYYLHKNNISDTIFTLDTLNFNSISFSFTPNIKYSDAISI